MVGQILAEHGVKLDIHEPSVIVVDRGAGRPPAHAPGTPPCCSYQPDGGELVEHFGLDQAGARALGRSDTGSFLRRRLRTATPSSQ